MNGNRSFEAEAQKEIILARLDHEAKEKKLDAILSEAGPEHDFSKVTTIDGTPREKQRIVRKILKDLAVLEETIERNSDELRGRKGKTTMAKTSSRDYTDSLYGIMPDDRKDEGAGLWKGMTFGEFVLKACTDNGSQLKALGIDTGEQGGFMIPDQWATSIMMVGPGDAIIRPRARVLPAGFPPDAKMDFPALRQGASGVLGGIQFAAANEGTAGFAADPKLDLVVLEPQRLSGYVTVGNSLLRNATASSAFIEQLFRSAKAAYEDLWFLTGAGLGLPQGVLNAPGSIRVPRATANTIHFADVLAMLAKQCGPNPIWVAHMSALPQIVAMADTNGNAMWIPAAYGGIQGNFPDRLAGKPIFWTFATPSLGSPGDLLLIDPSLYLVKDGSGPYIQASEHVLFTSDQTVVKCTFFLDGQPWVKAPLIMMDGVTTASPYIVLQ